MSDLKEEEWRSGIESELIWGVWQKIFDLQIKDNSYLSQYRSHNGIDEKGGRGNWKCALEYFPCSRDIEEDEIFFLVSFCFFSTALVVEESKAKAA